MEKQTTIYSIPGELKVVKKTIPEMKKIKTIEQIRDFENELSKQNYMTQQILDREKTYFRMYLNIKRRYTDCPEKFVKLFKLYLNQVPSFQKK